MDVGVDFEELFTSLREYFGALWMLFLTGPAIQKPRPPLLPFSPLFIALHFYSHEICGSAQIFQVFVAYKDFLTKYALRALLG